MLASEEDMMNSEESQTSGERIRAFCIDFNWGPGGPNEFAEPGHWVDAPPEEHVKWYIDLGANTIQTFCVSCNGYAWYKGGIVPEQPGLKTDFLKEVVRLGHGEGMRVMGYFCVGANTLWGQKHPDQSYGIPSHTHIAFTMQYIDYLCTSIQDALKQSGIDGFMLDWFFHGPYQPANVRLQWLPCEQQMWAELMVQPFPGKDEISIEQELQFKRRSVERCWDRIYAATKSVKPDCIIWLSCHELDNPQLVCSKIFKEVDWLMNEHPDLKRLAIAREAIGPHTKIIQCLCGWGEQHDATEVINDPRYKDVGFYGFAMPDETSFPPSLTTAKGSKFMGNAKNIMMLRKVFNAEQNQSYEK